MESLPDVITFQLDDIWYGMTHLYKGYEEIVSLDAFSTFRSTRFKGLPGEGFMHLILGHTHRQAVRYLSDDIYWLNPEELI